MVKSPLAGRVKTRLAGEVGVTRATLFYRVTARAVMTRLAADRRWTTTLAVAPDVDVCRPYWPQTLPRMAQGPGDLAARMQRIMDELPPGPVVIIGTDIPAVRPDHVAAAFKALGSQDAVFGPADDGGYWLVGQRRVPTPIDAFSGVRWSTEYALADTLANHRGRSVAMVAELSDVDCARDLRDVARITGRVVLPAEGFGPRVARTAKNRSPIGRITADCMLG